MLKLTPFDSYLIIVGMFGWPISLVLAVACIVILVKGSNAWVRGLALAALVFLIVPVIWYADWRLSEMWHDHERNVAYNKHAWKL